VRKINDQHLAAWFEHAAHLASALLACPARQVMEHQGAEHRVEPRIGERECFCDGILKRDSTPALIAFDVARAIISGEASMPTTSPVEPTRRLAASTRLPVPHPTSRTDAPVARRASSRSF
jgi:hypothetical protein